MAALALANPTLGGTTEAFAAADAAGDSFPMPTPLLVRARNNGVAARTITFVAQRACNQGVLHNAQVTIPNDNVPVDIRISDMGRFQDGNGRLQMTYDAAAGLSLAAYAQ